MFLNKKPAGISLVEIIIVLAISSIMFTVVIGFFSTRTRTAQDDAARLVVSKIAKVRNEAQQGLGPTSDSGRSLLAGNELFGQAIEFNGNTMNVYKLMKKPGDIITAYESYDIPLTQQLQWWIEPGSANAGYCETFTSCYTTPGSTIKRLFDPPVDLAGGERLLLVFKNNSGQSYVFSRKSASNVLGDNQFLGTVANKSSNYTSNRQGLLKLGYAVPGAGSTMAEQMANGVVQYYIHFDLSIPNEQRFEVVR